MKLYERFGARGYHTSIVMTFGVDFDAYENIVLPRLRGADCHNNILAADSRMLTQALGGATALPRFAGRWYTASGARAGAVFHPKMLIQLGRGGGRMIVSSANMTASGLAGNLELASEIICGSEEGGEQRLIVQGWRYALRILRESGDAPAGQTAWTLARTPWLRRAVNVADPQTLQDGTVAALLTSGGSQGIGEQFLRLIDDERATRLIAMSPYWDDSLKALAALAGRLSPSKTVVLIEPSARSFPAAAAKAIKGLKVFDAADFCGGRFLHAKAVIVQTRRWDHVLCGSANCTVAALGGQRFAGLNEEVCLYRRFPVGSLMEALGLNDLFDESLQVDLDALEIDDGDGELDLDAWNGRTPGRFECRFDILVWKPSDGIAAESVEIELLNRDGNLLPEQSTFIDVPGNGVRRYQLPQMLERPAFARLRHPDGTRSAPAIVTLVDKIAEAAKEPRSRRAENAVAQLAEETEEGLWMLDIFDTLEAAEAQMAADAGPDAIATRRKRDKKDDSGANPERFRTLSYEMFIAGRGAAPGGSSAGRSSLAGSDLSFMRVFLNRTLGLLDKIDADSGEEDEGSVIKALDLCDETGDAERLMSIGDTADSNRTTEEEQRLQMRLKAEQRKAARAQISNAALHFGQRLAERRDAGALTTFDILRLRALLTIEAAAGWRGRDGDATETPRTSMQVLPVESEDDSWPRVLGRTLFAFFGGTDPPVCHVQIDAVHQQLSDDILESWATCFWSLQAARAAPCSATERAKLGKYLTPLAQKVYRTTGLTRDEFASERVLTVMDRVNARFSERLGIDAKAIMEAHGALVRTLFDVRH
ncbi:MAG TPA: hypothetical protein VG889_00915 [Rhizomicrobium sp.]|nr:hypothetical protein [Rhizomicrobium sp.]